MHGVYIIVPNCLDTHLGEIGTRTGVLGVFVLINLRCVGEIVFTPISGDADGSQEEQESCSSLVREQEPKGLANHGVSLTQVTFEAAQKESKKAGISTQWEE